MYLIAAKEVDCTDHGTKDWLLAAASWATAVLVSRVEKISHAMLDRWKPCPGFRFHHQ